MVHESSSRRLIGQKASTPETVSQLQLFSASFIDLLACTHGEKFIRQSSFIKISTFCVSSRTSQPSAAKGSGTKLQERSWREGCSEPGCAGWEASRAARRAPKSEREQCGAAPLASPWGQMPSARTGRAAHRTRGRWPKSPGLFPTCYSPSPPTPPRLLNEQLLEQIKG